MIRLFPEKLPKSSFRPEKIAIQMGSEISVYREHNKNERSKNSQRLSTVLCFMCKYEEIKVCFFLIDEILNGA